MKEFELSNFNSHIFLILFILSIHVLIRPASGQVASEPYRWRNVSIVGGGFVTGLITHPRRRGLIYARTDVGGAYRRDSPSGEWIPITDMLGMSDWRLT